MIKPTLLILAAGMGSRYGGLKQMDEFGPNGETILDYSIYDAINEGFGKIVFVIRESFKNDFKEFFKGKFDDKVTIEYVMQDITMVPDDSKYNNDRERPWGTAHAVWVAKDVINEPFAVINADDFYGRDSYRVLFNFFNDDRKNKNYALVAYELEKTLSDHGTVNRGVCVPNDIGTLKSITECLKIGYNSDCEINYVNDSNETVILSSDTPVSMNMWAFYPDYFEYCENKFSEFLKEKGNELRSEYFIPLLIDALIEERSKKVEILKCSEEWFGVTYQEDKPFVIDKLRKLISSGVYPENYGHS